jgi:hypothetical protein
MGKSLRWSRWSLAATARRLVAKRRNSNPEKEPDFLRERCQPRSGLGRYGDVSRKFIRRTFPDNVHLKDLQMSKVLAALISGLFAATTFAQAPAAPAAPAAAAAPAKAEAKKEEKKAEKKAEKMAEKKEEKKAEAKK